MPCAGMNYARVCLTLADGSRSYRSIHILVYESFVGFVPAMHTVDHINRITFDNRLQNLAAKTFRGELRSIAHEDFELRW